MAARSFNSTVAAGLKPILRAIVNVGRGPGNAGHTPAKVGNATLIYGDVPYLHEEMRNKVAARRMNLGAGGLSQTSGDPSLTYAIARHGDVDSR